MKSGGLPHPRANEQTHISKYGKKEENWYKLHQCRIFFFSLDFPNLDFSTIVFIYRETDGIRVEFSLTAVKATNAFKPIDWSIFHDQFTFTKFLTCLVRCTKFVAVEYFHVNRFTFCSIDIVVVEEWIIHLQFIGTGRLLLENQFSFIVCGRRPNIKEKGAKHEQNHDGDSKFYKCIHINRSLQPMISIEPARFGYNWQKYFSELEWTCSSKRFYHGICR